MNEGSVRHVLIFAAIFMVAAGCAKIGTISGGPKDREAPVVLKTTPKNGALNFTGKEIIITFNEYVVLDKINEKFMASPPLAKRPQIVTRGKSIHIGIQEKLRDSTTYTLYFQDAIRDLNEGNPINNYQFVFSTGSFIDSLSVTGNVMNGLNLNPPENTLVTLYRNMADSFVVKHLPDYITRVEQNGEFRIDNVHQGTYRLYALKDGDNSKTYNNRDEEFAFYPDSISVTPGKNLLSPKIDTVTVKPVMGKKPMKPPVQGEYQLVLFQAEKKARYLTSSGRKMPYKLIYTLSLPPDSIKFGFSIPDARKESYFFQNSWNRDTIIVWLTDSTIYNRPQILSIVSYPFTDSLGFVKQKTDSITMRYTAIKPRGKTVKRTPYKVSNGIPSGQVRPDKQFIFTAPSPFAPPDTSRIRLYELIKDSRTRVPVKFEKDTVNMCRYKMQTQVKPGKSYLLIADSAAFKSIYGDTSDSTGTRFTVATPEMYGTLVLNLKNYEGNIIIQLLDQAEKIVRQSFLSGESKVTFPLLEKGYYRIRAIFDLNGDGKWTTGEFDLKRQPEPVTYYPTEVEVKENWELNQPWDLGRTNYKDFKLIQPVKAEQAGRIK
jgi:hypothetical protein